MSEFLTVRLSRQEDKPVSWLVWSTSQNEVIASGELENHGQLEELEGYAQQRTCIVLLDSSDVFLSQIDIPTGASRQLDAMLPFIMEDDLAQDVEHLHFHVLKKSSSEASVAVVEHPYLKQLLTKFSDVGIEVKRVIPDVLTLPFIEGGISALQAGERWLFRKGLYLGIGVEDDWLAYFAESKWHHIDDQASVISCYTDIPAEQIEGLEWKAEEPELVMELMARGAISSSINLLSGPFKPQSSVLKNMKVWRGAAIAASFFLIVLMVQNVVHISQAEAQATSYRAETERIFRAVFPDKKRIPTVSYLKRQMNSEVDRLSGGGSDESVLYWLSNMTEAIGEQDSIDFSSLRYDANRGEIRLEAEMKDFQTFEVVRTKLAEKFSVTQGPLNREGEKVTGSFVLRSNK